MVICALLMILLKSDSNEFYVAYFIGGVANNTELCCLILACNQDNSQNSECDQMAYNKYCITFTDYLQIPYALTYYWGAVEATPAISCYSSEKNGTKFQWTI